MRKAAICTGVILSLSILAVEGVENSESYNTAQAFISASDDPVAGEDFELEIEGTFTGTGSVPVFAYALYEDAEWSYDAKHRVVVSSGTLLDGSTFNWGTGLEKEYTLNRTAGVYKFTFIWGDRRVFHNFYDVAVDLYVEVQDPCPPTPDDIIDYIEDQDDDCFGPIKKALINKLRAVGKQIDEGAYHGAAQKLGEDVLYKIEKWVKCPNVRAELEAMVLALITYLAALE